MDYIYRVNMQVRNYDCEMHGVVSTPVYMQYLEHGRYEWLKSLGLNVAELAKEGHFVFVTKQSIEYKATLKYNDVFWVAGNAFRQSDFHLEATQDIFREDGEFILKSSLTLVGVNNGKYKLPQILIDKMPLVKND